VFKKALVAFCMFVVLLFGLSVSSNAQTYLPDQAFSYQGVPASVFSQLGQSGMWVQQAQQSFTMGSPHILVAYIEGGINLHDLSFVKTIDSSLWVNWHELPVPCSGKSIATATMVISGVTKPCQLYYSNNVSDYDLNGTGVINALQWTNDPRVKDFNSNGVIDPEDLLVAFSNNVNNDHDGFANDIFGWDFYENQNDPATQDAAYTHANGQMLVIHQMCPGCMIMPIRAGDEALDATNYLAQAWRYACMMGANVIVSVTADLGYSTAMLNSIKYCYQKGVAMFESSNDFDTPDYQGGMQWPYVVPGNGAVSNVEGLPSSYSSGILNRHWVRSDLTSWGSHNILTALTNGGSTSESTPTLGGVTALLLSWGYQAYQEGLISAPLTGQQAIELLIDTATKVTDPSLGWGGLNRNWNPQYGYGVPNVFKAMEKVTQGKIPDLASITSPNWYTIIDPTKDKKVGVYATITSYNAGAYHYELSFGIGQSPGSYTVIAKGVLTGNFSGLLGYINTSLIPQSYYEKPMQNSTAHGYLSMDQYDITIKLKVTTANGVLSQDRRVFFSIHDSSLINGFPLHFSSSIESQPALVDLQGNGVLDIVFADSNGYVYAIDPQTGKNLPGWPVHTLPVVGQGGFKNLNLGYQPIISPVAVGDLTGGGKEDVVVTSITGYTYAFGPDGTLLPGWPKTSDKSVVAPLIPRPDLPYTREPVFGAIAPPVLAHLGNSSNLYVIQAGLDGYIHIWNYQGQDLSGWPVKVTLPAGFTIPSGYVLINDQRLVSPPTVAYLNGYNSLPDLVIRSQYSLIRGPGVQPLAYSISFAYSLTGTILPNWPITLVGLFEYYGSAMDALTEGTFAPISVDALLNGSDQVIIAPQFSPAYLIGLNGQSYGNYGSVTLAAQGLLSVFLNPTVALNPSSFSSNEPIPFISFGAVGKVGNSMILSLNGVNSSYFAGAEVVPSSSLGILDYTTAYNLLTPQPIGSTNSDEISGFPTLHQGFDILGSPVIANVSNDNQEDIIEAGDSGALEAYLPSGQPVSGFPKFTGGWSIGAPAIGDLFSNGSVQIVLGTREGYLFAFNTSGLASLNNQWWRSYGDEYNNDRYGTQSRPPGAIRDLSWNVVTNQVSFLAPGDIWYSGKPAYYQVTYNPSGITQQIPSLVSAGSIESFYALPGQFSLTITAVGNSGLKGLPVTINLLK
jgi:hypothetical protein